MEAAVLWACSAPWPGAAQGEVEGRWAVSPITTPDLSLLKSRQSSQLF